MPSFNPLNQVFNLNGDYTVSEYDSEEDYGFNPLNQVFNLNHHGLSRLEPDGYGFNPLNQVFNLNNKSVLAQVKGFVEASFNPLNQVFNLNKVTLLQAFERTFKF